MKKIIITISNDLETDQRVLKTINSLKNIFDIKVYSAKSKYSSDNISFNFNTVRFRLLFKRKIFFYIELNLRLFFRLIFDKSNILWANDIDTALAVMLASKIKRIPYVLDAHEIFPHLPEVVNRYFVRKIWSYIEKLTIKNANMIFTVNYSLANYFAEKYNVKPIVIYNYPLCNSSYSHIDCDIIDKIKNIRQKKIIYQGSLNVGRGLEELIQAVAAIKNCVLIIAGKGDVERQLKLLVKQLGLKDRVFFLGRVKPYCLRKITPLADVGVSIEKNIALNYVYASPNKLFDYIHAKIPVLVTDLQEMTPIVKENDIGLILNTFTLDNLVEKLNILLFDENKRATWKHNLSEIAGKYCWEKQQTQLFDIEKLICKND